MAALVEWQEEGILVVEDRERIVGRGRRFEMGGDDLLDAQAERGDQVGPGGVRDPRTGGQNDPASKDLAPLTEGESVFAVRGQFRDLGSLQHSHVVAQLGQNATGDSPDVGVVAPVQGPCTGTRRGCPAAGRVGRGRLLTESQVGAGDRVDVATSDDRRVHFTDRQVEFGGQAFPDAVGVLGHGPDARGRTAREMNTGRAAGGCPTDQTPFQDGDGHVRESRDRFVGDERTDDSAADDSQVYSVH